MDSAEVYQSVANPFAPMYWGLVVSLLLGGIALLQGYIYFSHAKDHAMIRLMAATMLIFDFVDSALVSYSVYFYLIPRFGSVSRLGVLPKEMAVECLTAIIITTISQLFFVYQLVGAKRFGKGYWSLISVIVVLSLLALGGGIACVVIMSIFEHGILHSRNRSFEIIFGVTKGLGSVTDIVATVAMILFLNSVRTGMNRTNSLLDSLIQLILNRGVLVTVAQLLLLITFYASPRTLTWLFFHVNLPKLYVNTFFGMLNARDRIKAKHIGDSIKLRDSESQLSQRKLTPAFGPRDITENSTLVGDVQSEKASLSANRTAIMMSSVVTTVVS